MVKRHGSPPRQRISWRVGLAAANHNSLDEVLTLNMSLIQPSPPPQTHPHLLRGTSYSSIEPPNSDLPRNIPVRSARGQQTTVRLPQQYAHPVPQRIDLSSSQSSSSQHGGLSISEHMLRRKTPNGVLSAAYDGTATTQNDRPHHMKHILLPVNESRVDGSLSMLQHQAGGELPLQSPLQSYTTDVTLGSQRLHPQNQVWDPGVKGGFAPDGWIPGQNHPQIDSMLNQIPMQQLGQFQQGPDYYGFMQASITPSGPTISNSMGPYGPYWPGGEYVPYRLAAFRDPRYQPHYTTNWRGAKLPAGFGGVPERYGSQGLNQQMLIHPANNFNMGPPQFPLAYGSNQTPVDLAYQPNLFDNGKSLEYFSVPSPLVDKSGDSTPRGGQTPTPTGFDSHSNNTNRRESIFSWAHSVYVSLLEYLRHTRRAASNNRHIQGYHHAQRPNIYPKPPRQQNYDFQTHVQMRRANDRNASYPTVTPVDNPVFQAPQTWPSQHGQPSPHLRQGSWHSALSGAAPFNAGSDRAHTLRRSSGPSGSISALPSPIHRDQSPTATAILALETLERLCRESSWKWVEGILLGGCLAYALSDYTKAMRWYSTILELDQK